MYTKRSTTSSNSVWQAISPASRIPVDAGASTYGHFTYDVAL